MAVNQASFLLFFFCLLSVLQSSICDNTAIQNKCSQEFPKVTNCLDYATGNANAPSNACCSSVEAIQTADAVCLCYIIQQAHNGNPAIKNIGLQFSKLLRLPTVCNLKENISDCTKLLNITRDSPDYSIFTANATSPGTATRTNTSSPETAPSKAIMNQIRFQGTMVLGIVSAIFLSFFSLGA